ncbi:MAG TPA: hypothetical protein P5227_09035, partial [Emcibacteraceae bacterium]|nr:hypothetical protein [Emcibacteraceae bacterium]
IQVSSNFERLLFNIYNGSGADVRHLMENLKQSGSFIISSEQLDRAKETFDALRVAENETKSTIAEVYNSTGQIIDPHTAVGIHAARQIRQNKSVPMISLSTAHPAKFPEAVEDVTGIHPALPAHMADLFDREEKFDILPNDLGALKKYILDHL